jgi:dihydropteroate synthase
MSKELRVGTYRLPLGGKTLVMGILNVTPDSFSDGGKYDRLDSALFHAQKLAAEGADILDIGGESTRPQANPVSLEEELERVIPVIAAVSQAVDLPLSIDTYKAEVAREAVRAGAHLINDVGGEKREGAMVHVAAELEVPIVLLHHRTHAKYRSFIAEVIFDLEESIQLAKEAGVKEEQILVDPGIGFAKTYEMNLEVLRHLDQIVALGYPVLLGTSRKSFIGKTLGLPPNERMEGTAATVAYGIVQGCQMVRVHDVKEMVRVCRMMDAMLDGSR